MLNFKLNPKALLTSANYNNSHPLLIILDSYDEAT